MSAVALGAELVGVEDHAVGAGGLVVQPTEEGWAEVVTHPRVVVHDADDFVFFIRDAGGAVGSVTLGGDAVVPVMVGSGGVLDFDGLEPGVFALRLVEVAVNADEAWSFGACLRLRSFRDASFGHIHLEGIAVGGVGWVGWLRICGF